MNYIAGTPRDQLCLFEDKLDNLIPDDHLVRFIDLYVDKLDLVQLKIENINKTQGAPGYNPALYLKIYIYSYLNKIRSSRKIERECKRNLELIWLTSQLTPDHWSISNFRKKNKKALKNLFKEFLRFCHKLNLLSLECIAIDGTKMRAQNNLSNVYKKDQLDNLLKKIDEKINDYLVELDSNDQKEQDEYAFLSTNIPKKINQLKKHKDKIEIIKKVFNENPELERYFANDTDSRFQSDNGRCVTGYNCQAAADEKNKLIIANDVSNSRNDKNQLSHMKSKTDELKNELDITNDKSVIVADSGYFSEKEIFEVEEDNKVDLYVPHPSDIQREEKKRNYKNKIPAKGYEKKDFIYHEEKDLFVCPEGHELTKYNNKVTEKNGVKYNRYRTMACKNCAKRYLCTKSQKRNIEISENYIKLEKFRKKTKSDIGKKVIRKRKEIIEHPFGTIKRNLGFTYFMQTGLENVKAEFNFISFIYNFKRVIKLVGVKDLIKTLDS